MAFQWQHAEHRQRDQQQHLPSTNAQAVNTGVTVVVGNAYGNVTSSCGDLEHQMQPDGYHATTGGAA